jgi:hypothetical protein
MSHSRGSFTCSVEVKKTDLISLLALIDIYKKKYDSDQNAEQYLRFMIAIFNPWVFCGIAQKAAGSKEKYEALGEQIDQYKVSVEAIWASRLKPAKHFRLPLNGEKAEQTRPTSTRINAARFGVEPIITDFSGRLFQPKNTPPTPQLFVDHNVTDDFEVFEEPSLSKR